MLNFNHRTKSRNQLLVLLILTLVLNAAPAQAEVKATDIIEAIEKNNVFAVGIRVSVKVVGSEALISTYRNSQATNDDCKIEATIAAKTVFETVPDGISRVKVYFFEPTLDKFKEVAISKGDVLSFNSGQTTQEDLMSSITIKNDGVWDAAANIADYLDASRRRPQRRNLLTRIKNKEIEILASMDSWASDAECKLEAMKIAERALQAAIGYHKVKIVFVDPQNQKEDRFIVFNEEDLQKLAKNVDEMLASIQISQAPGLWLPSERFESKYPDAFYAGTGFMQKERAAILERIKSLSKQGAGAKPLLLSFLQLEDAAAQGNQSDVTALLERLTKSLDEQEARAVEAKTAKLTADKKTPKPPPAQPKPATTTGDMNDASIKGQILRNPAAAYDYYVKRWKKAGTKPEDYPNYLKLMQLFVRTLNDANRPQEAKAYEDKVVAVKKIHPDW